VVAFRPPAPSVCVISSPKEIYFAMSKIAPRPSLASRFQREPSEVFCQRGARLAYAMPVQRASDLDTPEEFWTPRGLQLCVSKEFAGSGSLRRCEWGSEQFRGAPPPAPKFRKRLPEPLQVAPSIGQSSALAR